MKIIYDKADEKLFREYAKKHKVGVEALKLYFQASVATDTAGILEELLAENTETDRQYVEAIRSTKLWKLQRPLFTTTGRYNDIAAYEVDDTGERVDEKNFIIPMPKKVVKELFHGNEYAKVYYVGEIKDGKLEVLAACPVLEDLWA